MEKDTEKTTKPQPILPNGDALSKDEVALPSAQSWLEHITKWIGVLFFVLTIILFASGQGYREGYFSGFSVDISQVSISFHETLYWGYLANVPYGALFLLTLAYFVISLGGFTITVGWLFSKFQQRWPALRPSQSTKKPSTKLSSPGLIMALTGLGIVLIIYVLGFGYLIPKTATDHGRAQAGLTMKAFLADEMKAAETYKLRCVHMKWAKDESGESREMFAYQLFCHDKLCKVFEPVTKTFPTVFLDGIRSITPYPSPVGQRESCIAGGSIGSK